MHVGYVNEAFYPFIEFCSYLKYQIIKVIFPASCYNNNLNTLNFNPLHVY